MNKKIIIVAAAFGIFALMGIAAAVISSYGSISGAAIVQPAISWDVLESYSDVNSTATNDTAYVLETAYPGETKWIKIRIVNAGDATIPVNISVANSRPSDVTITVMDENKTQPLQSPVPITHSGLYIWLKHDFSTGAEPGSYSFSVGLLPG